MKKNKPYTPNDNFKRLYHKTDKELINKILRRIPDKYLDKLCQQVKGNNHVRVYVKYDGCQFQCSRKTIYDEYYLRHYNMKKYQFEENRKEFFRNLTKVKTNI